MLAQIAADALGLDVEQVEFRTGTSDLPDGGIAGGSAHTATAAHDPALVWTDAASGAGHGRRAFAAVRRRNAGLVARDGRLLRRDDESRSESYGDILARAGVAEIDGRGKSTADPVAQANYAARARRVCGGKKGRSRAGADLRHASGLRLRCRSWVINPRLVSGSQYYGGMIWGVSFALHERAVMDLRTGRVMNPNLGEYHKGENADIPSLEAILVDEHDEHVNALGIKGVGEIGVTGTAGAIANAVWHATGVRVRSFPITLDRLFEPA